VAGTQRLICASAALADGGKGVRFSCARNGRALPAFVVRFRGRMHAYVNQCAHVGVELDWAEGEFFDPSGVYLICATHGATYEPDTGYCVGGPCAGASLVALPVTERDGNVYLHPESDFPTS
jgi:nitrite reductase/ring-hydroxylating ferredoxin subunit